jgi:hypothetical protein
MNLLHSQPDLFWGGAFVLVALAVLARLMLNRRNQVLGELYAQIETERAEKVSTQKTTTQKASPQISTPSKPKAAA